MPEYPLFPYVTPTSAPGYPPKSGAAVMGKLPPGVGKFTVGVPGAVGGAVPGPRGGATRSSAGGAADLSVPVFAPGNGLRVPELLQALRWVKGSPLVGAGPISGSGFKLQAQVQQAASVITTVPVYSSATQTVGFTPDLTAVTTFSLVRIGFLINALKIDAAATVQGSASNPADWLPRAASAQLIRLLDQTIGIGSSTSAPIVPGLYGWASASPPAIRTAASSNNIEKDARYLLTQIFPTGNGDGEGPDCLIGDSYTMRALMATTSGQTGLSGWRHDPRIGRPVYHYMGIPFYRTASAAIDETVLTSTLFAANLGSSGLALIYAYGTPDSYGFQADELPLGVTYGSVQYLVHGAFTLAFWEPDAIFAITGTPIGTR